MNKSLEHFSIKLEELLRNNKSIVDERDQLLIYMFGGTPFESEIKKTLSHHSLDHYFLIGKILFLIDNIEDNIKNIKNLINSLKDKKYIIITEDFKIEDLQTLLSAIVEKSKNIQEDDEVFIENEWESLLIKIKEIDVVIKEKINSNYFTFDKLIGNEFKLHQIITLNFENACQTLFNSKSNNYQKNKLDNALFLSSLSKVLKNRTIFDKLIGISKDKISDFKIITSNLTLNKDWDNLSWKDIKAFKEK